MDIAVTTILLFAVFGILLFVGCPISVSIVVSSIVTALSSLSWDQITFITMQKMNGGVESFSLLAVPLFILAGNIMNNGGIARRLVNFAKLFWMDTRISCPGKCTWKHAVRSSFWFRSSSFFCNGRMYLPNSERRRL